MKMSQFGDQGSEYGPSGHGYFEPVTPRIAPIRCVVCGRFMNCGDPDASCDFTPDSHRSSERIEWTCGPCERRRQHQEGQVQP